MTRPLFASPTRTFAAEPAAGGHERKAGPQLAQLAGCDAADAAARCDRLDRENAVLRERMTALQVQIDLLTHMVEHLQARQELAVTLPLPVARLFGLLFQPVQSTAFLRDMVDLDVLTGTALVPGAKGRWERRIHWGKVARNVARDFSGLVFGRRGVVYRVRPQHPPQTRRRRLLHVIPNVFVGGSTQLVVDLMERLGHLYEMEVVTAALPRNGRHEGMVVHQVPLGSPAESFVPVIAKARPDLIHMHYWGESDRPWYEAALAAIRPASGMLLQNVNTPVEPLRDPRVHSYLFVSQYIRDTFAPDIANGRVIHPGIDLDRFTPGPFAPGAEDTIGMVYRLTRDKLDDNSIDPLIDVALRRPRTRILVVGNGELLPVFRDRARDAGAMGNFEFTGTVPFAALPDLYRQFRIFVAPVVKESFGQVTPFAMAMGQAVAGYRVGALPEIIGSGDTLGATRKDLADILISLLDAPACLDVLGAANIERARAFGLDGMVAAYGEAYAEALSHLDLVAGGV